MRLKARGLNVALQGSHILRDIGIDVGDGEFVCLLGRNGAGKTTLLRAVMRFLALQSGDVLLDDASIVAWTPTKVAQHGVGYSPEESEVFSSLTVAQNIEMPTWVRRPNHNPAGRIALAYEIFPKLKRYLHRYGDQLSGGERKMLSIARALALDPGLLLLDEPFEGLSPAIIPEISEAILRVTKLGVSVLQAESNLHHVPKFAKRIYVIERGEIIYSGTVSDAFQDRDVRSVMSGEAITAT